MTKLKPGKLYKVVTPIWVEQKWTNERTHLMFIGHTMSRYEECHSIDFLSPSGRIVKFEKGSVFYQWYSKILEEVNVDDHKA